VPHFEEPGDRFLITRRGHHWDGSGVRNVALWNSVRPERKHGRRNAKRVEDTGAWEEHGVSWYSRHFATTGVGD